MKKIRTLVCFSVFFILIMSVVVKAEKISYVPSLMYHNINDAYELKNDSVEITQDGFEEHIKTLKENGFTPIFFNEYLDYRLYRKQLPDKPILITFDDGYLNNYTIGFEILKKYDAKATIFIVTGRMGLQGAVTYPHFTWEQALEMEKSGLVDIQSHTQYHSHLSQIGRASLVVELRKSKYTIEKNLNKKVNILAYPYGEQNDRVITYAKEAGYDACVLADPINAGVNRDDTNLMLLKRITVYGSMSGEDLLKEIKNNESW